MKTGFSTKYGRESLSADLIQEMSEIPKEF
jgi:hypothetical protein